MMHHRIRLTLLAAAMGFAARAQNVPSTLNYQGRLTDNGPAPAPLNTTVNMTFEIWDVPSGGTAGINRLWLEPASGATPVVVTGGIFNVLLGASAGGGSVPIPASLFSGGTTRYLQLIVNGETLTPRQTISATGYTHQAQNAALAANATSAVTATNAIQLGGVAAAGWQRSLTVASCSAGQFYNAIDPAGTAGCATVQSTLTPPLALSGALAGPVISGSNSSTGSGVLGVNSSNNASAFGVLGRISSTTPGSFSAGVRGENLGTGGNGIGVWGSHAGNGYGVYGTSAGATGLGVYGIAPAATGLTHGVAGVTNSSTNESAGVLGFNTAATGGTYGVHGQTSSTGAASGVYGISTGATGFTRGVYGVATDSPNGIGVVGRGGYSGGDFATPAGSAGGFGVTGAATGVNGWSVFGVGNSGASGQYGGYFGGNVNVSGTLSKGAGSFKIDHPLDPENKYLYHSFVESPDMMNLYNGNAVLDSRGEAVVEMPQWFGALNRDFRYQLTCIGGFAPVYIGEELKDNRFKIAGGRPGLKISWMVTGIRKDPYADKHRIPVEQDKPALERGHYLHPADYGQSEEKGVEWAIHPEMMKRVKDERKQTQAQPASSAAPFP